MMPRDLNIKERRDQTRRRNEQCRDEEVDVKRSPLSSISWRREQKRVIVVAFRYRRQYVCARF